SSARASSPVKSLSPSTPSCSTLVTSTSRKSRRPSTVASRPRSVSEAYTPSAATAAGPTAPSKTTSSKHERSSPGGIRSTGGPVEAVERPAQKAASVDPHISIVIPIYNEQAILHAAVVDLRERLKPFGWSYEIILAENGSRDRTVEIGHQLAAKYED